MSKLIYQVAMGIVPTLLTMWLSGCASMTMSDAGNLSRVNSHFGTRVGMDELNRFFDSAQPGSRLQAASSPWGEGVEVTVAGTYDAASGRQCHDLSISKHASESSAGIVCRVLPGQWESVRPITRNSDVSANRL